VLDLPEGFAPGPGPALLEGQWAVGTHTPTGGGYAIRSLPAAPYLEVRERVAGRIDVGAALSADRYLMLALQQSGASDLHTLYVGPADGVDSQVGRWVYSARADDGHPLVWWHVAWRTPTAFVELAAWAPLEQLPRLGPAMRQVEAAGVIAVPPAETLLFESGQQGCGPAMHADRASAVRATRRFGDAREILHAGYAPSRDRPDAAATLLLAEHRAFGVLYRHAESCVHEVARRRRVCTVVEGPVRGPAAEAFQEALVNCLDDDAALSRDLESGVEAVWASP